ncbi:MAG: hypothetical protein JOS17DRAFT_752431 [Linnemannia elongata]|nr:MAG: hypothetical protein JOS17DRAFT_720174 [Linnemannia elongata]KAK3823866.1 MAG: hypothetical protein JOS17DRAFT_752431 [Linnemannia elongata]
MSAVAGTFRVASPGSTFTSTFVINEIAYSFTGSFGGTSVEPCNGVVMLTYAKLEDLTSSRNFNGVIGKTSAKLILTNNVEISGSLDNPIMVANSVTGTGRWGVTRDAE